MTSAFFKSFAARHTEGNSHLQRGKSVPFARRIITTWSHYVEIIVSTHYVCTETNRLVHENTKLSVDERLAILQERYPEAPEKLLEAIALHGGYPLAFAKILRTVAPCNTMSLPAVSAGLLSILKNKSCGWNLSKEPNAVIQAAANLTGWPLDDFVPVLSDDERLNNWRNQYPMVADALLQVMVPFKTISSFAKEMLNVEPLKSKQANLNNVCARLSYILASKHDSDLVQTKEPDGTRKPNTIIQAVAELTGLDVRYFLQRRDGGIGLKRSEKIVYDEDSKTFAIVNTGGTAQPQRYPTAAM